MSIEFKLPELGEGIDGGDLVDVYVQEGDTIRAGQEAQNSSVGLQDLDRIAIDAQRHLVAVPPARAHHAGVRRRLAVVVTHECQAQQAGQWREIRLGLVLVAGDEIGVLVREGGVDERLADGVGVGEDEAESLTQLVDGG